MNTCHKIESLMYLYRDGELSADEQQTVREHTRTCDRCDTILRQLRSIDDAAVPLRIDVPVLPEDSALVNDTIRLISRASRQTINSDNSGFLADILFGWVRPVLSFVVLAATVLFIVQQAWDSQKINMLEQRIQTAGHTTVPNDALRFLSIDPSSLRNASVGSELAKLFKQNNGLFEYLARRYPNLSTITPENGIDEQERRILMTEGKVFLKEFQQLLHEGE
jgi:hypothetical protein